MAGERIPALLGTSCSTPCRISRRCVEAVLRDPGQDLQRLVDRAIDTACGKAARRSDRSNPGPSGRLWSKRHSLRPPALHRRDSWRPWETRGSGTGDEPPRRVNA